MKKKEISTVDFSFRDDMTIDKASMGKCDYKYELIYVTLGSGKFIIEGSNLPIEPRTFYIFKPLTYYAIDTEGREFNRLSITFSKEDIHQRLWDYLDSIFQSKNGEIPYATVKCSDVEDIERILLGIEFAKKLPEDQKQQYIATVVSQLLIVLSSGESKHYAADNEELSVKVIDYINYNITKGNIVTLDNLARYFFVSKFYLCRVFKKHNGISIHSYINQKRIMIAKQYIDSGMSAAAAADMVGYGDYSAFYRAYVKIVGKAPTSQKGEPNVLRNSR